MREHALFIDDRFDLAQEPRVEPGNRLDFLDRQILAEGLRDPQDALGRALRQRRSDLVLRYTLELGHAVETVEPSFEPAQRLLHALGETAPDRHDLAH